jgi:hypothetical protein
LTRIGRTVALSVVALSVFTAVSLTGCGAAHTVLGIREPPKANFDSAPLTVDQSDRILTRAFTAAQQAEATTGAASHAAAQTAYTGAGLRRANAQARLAKVRPASADSPILAPRQPRLLGVSRGFGYPRVIVAQTVPPQGSLPILHLLISPDALTPYRISGSVEMMPSSSVKPFDSLALGSPLLTDGTGLAVAPTALFNTYAAGMAFPAKATANRPFATDPFSDQVRAKAAGVAGAVAGQATFSQVHKVVPGSVYALRQAGGDALVFGVIERNDTFGVKPGQTVNTADNKEFVLLTGKKSVTKAALLTTLEFLVFAVPRSRGEATLVAASEQLVAGTGS